MIIGTSERHNHDCWIETILEQGSSHNVVISTITCDFRLKVLVVFPGRKNRKNQAKNPQNRTNIFQHFPKYLWQSDTNKTKLLPEKVSVNGLYYLAKKVRPNSNYKF